ncbi:MAG: ATP-binding protein [Candidatus Omnitrophica bacterium]|nr:ATP-binding protein [Candidatus Omnitrophota bacterium]
MLKKKSKPGGKNKYRHIFVSNIPVGLYRNTSGPKGHFISGNPAIVKMFGYDSVEEFMNISVSDIYIDPKERKDFSERLITKGQVSDINLRLKKKDGTMIWASVSARAVYNKAGQIKYFDGMVEDITLRKQMEKQLEEARKTAETSNRTKSMFLANMSHEIRTPMNAILGFAQLMQKDRTLTAEQRKHLEIISHSGEHLLTLINDILDMSKIEAGRMTFTPVTFDLHTLLLDIEMMFRVRTDAKGLLFKVEGMNEIPEFVVTDEGKVRQILINLLGNAVKFTDKGSILLQVGMEKKEEQIFFIAEIIDTGTGISRDDIPRLFHAFQQSSTRTQTIEGTGLGLAISREFARLLGGDIEVRSKVNEGSCFRVKIKIQETKNKPVTAAPEKHVIGLQPGLNLYRILVVDDKPENRLLLSEILRAVGFETRESADGSEAISEFQTWKPHLIMMDIRMPAMDGYEAIRRIRAIPEGAGIPIIAVTASLWEEDRQKIKESGANLYIRKPFREYEVFDAIGTCLGVKYVYEEKDKIQPTQTDEIPLTGESLKVLPEDTVSRLREASISLDFDRLMEIIENITPQFPQLAEQLKKLAADFQFDTLLKLISEKSA